MGINPPAVSTFTGQYQISGLQAQTFSTSSASWTTVSYTFTATKAASTLIIWSTTAGSYGPYIDNFSLYAADASLATPAQPSTNPLSSQVIIQILSLLLN